MLHTPRGLHPSKGQSCDAQNSKHCHHDRRQAIENLNSHDAHRRWNGLSSIGFVQVHVHSLPPIRHQLISQALGAVDESPDVGMHFRGDRPIGGRVTDGQGKLTRIIGITDRTPELLVRRQTQTPEDQTVGRHLGQENPHSGVAECKDDARETTCIQVTKRAQSRRWCRLWSLAGWVLARIGQRRGDPERSPMDYSRELDDTSLVCDCDLWSSPGSLNWSTQQIG